MRALIFELGDDAMADGFVAALERHASTLSAQDGVRIEVEGPDHRPALGPQVESQLFGIGREALTNVVKHAQASRATVRVEERTGHVRVEIQDDGNGFDPTESAAGHYGLESMRSRAAEIDASLSIASTRGEGTLVRIEVPLDAGQPDGTRD
jgi:signal transduction histidine kinase